MPEPVAPQGLARSDERFELARLEIVRRDSLVPLEGPRLDLPTLSVPEILPRKLLDDEQTARTQHPDEFRAGRLSTWLEQGAEKVAGDDGIESSGADGQATRVPLDGIARRKSPADQPQRPTARVESDPPMAEKLELREILSIAATNLKHAGRRWEEFR